MQPRTRKIVNILNSEAILACRLWFSLYFHLLQYKAQNRRVFYPFELWPPRNLGLAALFLTTRVMWSSRQSLKLSPTTLQSTPQLKPLEFLTTKIATQNISKVPIQTVNHATLSRLAAIIGLDGKALTIIPKCFIKFKWLIWKPLWHGRRISWSLI